MKRYIVIFLFTVISTLSIVAQEITFKTEAPKVVGKDERFKVSFVVNSSSPKNFNAPTFEGVNVLSGPNVMRSSSVTIINGKRESNTTTTYTYFLQSINTGTITIPVAKVTVDNRTYYTRAVNIKVENNPTIQQRATNNPNYNPYANQPKPTKIDENSVFVRAIPNKTKVTLGEEIIISYKIYTLVPVSEYQVDKFPSSQGFWVEELDNQPTPTLEKEVINGKQYNVATLRRVLVYPQKTGTLQIAPMGLEVLAHIQTGVQRAQRQSTGDPFFDAFFNDPFFSRATPVFETVNKKLKTNSLEIEVSPLPDNPSFSGGVGQFTFEEKIDTTHCKTNEAITLEYTIKGSGNLTLIDNLNLKFPSEFEVFEPKIIDKITKTSSGQKGERTFQYVIIPRVEGDFKVPAVEFTYYNPETKEFETLKSQEYNLNITKGNNSNEYVEYLTEREKYKNMDIINSPYHKTTTVLLKPFHSPIFYSILVLIFVLLLIMIKLTKTQIEKNKDVVGIKLKKANKVAVKRLKQSRLYLNNKEFDKFENEIGQALWNYLSDKFKISNSDLNLENIRIQLQNSKLEEELLNKTITVVEKCEYVRFSQNKGTELYEELYSQTQDVITEIESQMVSIKKQSKKALLLILFLLILTNISANPAPETAFLYNKTGNEYFKNSDYVNARLYYEKALKLYPNDEIYQTNNKIVQTRLMGEVYKIPDFFLVKWFKSFYNLFTPIVWAVISIFLFLTSAILFFIYYFSFDKKVLYFYLMLTCFVVSVLCISSGVSRENSIHSQDYAIITQLPENHEKTKLFRGQKVEIKAKKDTKLLILTEDGKEHWIESKNLTII